MEMKKIVESAEQSKAEGEEKFSGEEHKRLLGILKNEDVKETLPKTSNSTYGLGGSNYFGTTPFTTTQGTQKFGQAVSGIEGIGKTEHLGNRESGFHDEMHQISTYPGLQALVSSQGHCFFCYGTIHNRGYQHGALRPDPWPQMWTHDYMGFTIKLTNEYFQGDKNSPVILIESEKYGSRYYFVRKN